MPPISDPLVRTAEKQTKDDAMGSTVFLGGPLRERRGLLCGAPVSAFTSVERDAEWAEV